MVRALDPPRATGVTDALRNACAKTWGDPQKRVNKSVRILRMVGVHPTEKIEGRQVPDVLVDKLSAMTAEEAFKYFTETTE